MREGDDAPLSGYIARMLGVRVPLLVAVCVLAACSSPRASAVRPQPVAAPEVVLSPVGAPAVTVAVELARSHEELEKGLMFRPRLELDHGMLFFMPRSERQTFWMRNTYIPLDMIFIGADRKVVGIVEKAEPLTETPRAVDGSSQFVLEVAGGWAASHRIAPGTPVQFNHVD